MAKKKLSNDEIVMYLKKRKIFRILLAIFGLLTIILAVLSLIFNISPIFCIISFVIEAIISNNFKKYEIKKEDSDSKNQE